MFTGAHTPNWQGAEAEVKSSVSLYIKEAVVALTRDDRLHCKYMTANVLSKLIQKRYTFIDVLDFDEPSLNGAMTKHFPGIESKNGNESVFRLEKNICDQAKSKRRRVKFYYFRDEWNDRLDNTETTGNSNNSDFWNDTFTSADNIEQFSRALWCSPLAKPQPVTDVSTRHTKS
jgi:hypothetical protein